MALDFKEKNSVFLKLSPLSLCVYIKILSILKKKKKKKKKKKNLTIKEHEVNTLSKLFNL